MSFKDLIGSVKILKFFDDLSRPIKTNRHKFIFLLLKQTKFLCLNNFHLFLEETQVDLSWRRLDMHDGRKILKIYFHITNLKWKYGRKKYVNGKAESFLRGKIFFLLRTFFSFVWGLWTRKGNWDKIWISLFERI